MKFGPGWGSCFRWAIALGLVVSAVRVMYQMSHVHFEVDHDGEHVTLRVFGSATSLGLPKLQDALHQIEPDKDLHIKFERLDFIDYGCLDVLDEFRMRYEEAGGSVVVDWNELFDKRTKASQHRARGTESESDTGT